MKYMTVLAMAVFLMVPGMAQADGDADRTLTVTGQGAVQAAPDMAEITVGVVTQAPTARAALSENNEKAAQVMAFLKESGVADKDMQSTNLSVSPQYNNRRNGEPVTPDIVGYVVNNNLRIAVRDLAAFGKILDGVVTSGANNVNGVRFDVSNREELERNATANAVKDAMARAKNIAQAAGVKLEKPITITEAGGYRPPQPFLARAEASSVPIAAGELSIGASVTVVFEID